MTDPARAVKEKFARRLRALRVPRGFKTARSFAQALGIDENRYTRYERAEVEPDLSLIQRICETLRITPNDLLNLKDDLATGYSSGFAKPEDQAWTAGHEFEPHGSGSVSAGTASSHRATANNSAPSAVADPKSTRRRVLAWQLAARLAALSAGQPLAPLKLTTKYFAEIEADPFAIATRLSNEAALTRADEAEQQRIAAMVDALVSAVEETLTE